MGAQEEKAGIKDKVKTLFGAKKKAGATHPRRSEPAYIYKSESDLRTVPDAQLVMGDAPENPLYGKQFADNTVYAITKPGENKSDPWGAGKVMSQSEIEQAVEEAQDAARKVVENGQTDLQASKRHQEVEPGPPGPSSRTVPLSSTDAGRPIKSALKSSVSGTKTGTSGGPSFKEETTEIKLPAGAGSISVPDILRKEEERPEGTNAYPFEIPQRPGTVIQAKHVVMGFTLATALAQLLFLRWWGSSLFELLLWGTLPGLLLGALLAFAYSKNREGKRLINNALHLTPGRKGLTGVLGEVPYWVQFTDQHRLEWFNRLLGELWPYYDKAIGKTIKEVVEPIMDEYKPPGLIKRIFFKNLTLGDAPMRAEHVWVEEKSSSHVLFEIAFRWAGEANISIAIDLPLGGEATRMVPKVTDLRVSGVARVLLSPLVNEIPGFGAAVVALRKPPLIHFNLDFGSAFGGSYTARAIRLWLDPFLRTTLASMVVWPNRIVVPILPESVTGPLDHLYLRNQGLLVVNVLEAKGLKKADTIGKSDPFVELWTQATAVAKTRVIKNSLDPVWQETHYVLVQEPDTQSLNLEVFDWDMFNVKELVQVNLLKGAKDMVGSKTFLGRTSVPISQLVDAPGVQKDEWFELGRGAWGNPEGTGYGEGKIHLKLAYWPWELLYESRREAQSGAVLVTVKKASNLPASDDNGLADPYARLQLDTKRHTTKIKPKTLAPEWNESFEWHNVDVQSSLEVTVWDWDGFMGDTCLGTVEIDISSEVAREARQPVLKTWYLEEVPEDIKLKKVPSASVTLQIQWVPFDFQ